MEKIEVIAVGREVLDGRVIDTNSIFIAQALKQKGHVMRYAQRVGDDFADVARAFAAAEERSDFVVVTGGLGPTVDDLTAEAFARHQGVKLVRFEEAVAHVRERYRTLGRALTPETEPEKLKQAFLPEGSRVLDNPNGTAPGFTWKGKGAQWFFLPGVPKEMKPMIQAHVLSALSPNAAYRSFHWATQFTGESDLQTRIRQAGIQVPEGAELLFRTRFPENHVGLEMLGHDERAAEFDAAAKAIGRLLAPETFSSAERVENLPALEQEVVRAATARGAWLVAAESCTGGLVTERLTQVPGSSAVLWGSFITYDNRAKESLGVDPALLRAHGAVSEPVAKALAVAARQRVLGAGGMREEALWSVATTGIAGPGGATAEKPVGLCFVALAGPGGELRVSEIRARAHWTRAENKLLFSQHALEHLRKALIRP